MEGDFLFPMIDKFLEYIRVERRYSSHTITSYRKDLEDFSGFLLASEGHGRLQDADRKMVRNFIVSLSEAGASRRTINRKLSALRSFYLFLLKIDEIKVSPLENIDSLKFYPEKQVPFSTDEMQDLKENFEKSAEVPLLERLIIETLYQTGMRKAELCNLQLRDIDFSKKELRITGKGNKQRVVPISEDLMHQFAEFLQERTAVAGSGIYFFTNARGKKLGERFVYSVVNRYLSTVTSKQKRSPHILRHTFATHVLNNGAEISKVKSILGHASLASTQVYTAANIEQLKSVFGKAHPRARKDEEDV